MELIAPLSGHDQDSIIQVWPYLNTETGPFDVIALSAGELGNSLLETSREFVSAMTTQYLRSLKLYKAQICA